METMRKLYNFEVKQLEDRVLRFTGSTETEDRDGEVIKVSGWQLENYKKNPVFMWAHDYSQPPIGKTVNVHKRQGNLIFDVEFAPKETYEFADTIYKLYQGGFLNATSVGFMPDPEGVIEGDGIKTPRRTYTKQELLELSAVPVPSNPDALRNAADKIGVSVKSLKGIFEDIQDAEIVDLTTKPEETDNFIHIPAPGEEGKHGDHRIRTITLSDKEGIKAKYCGDCKKNISYMFDKDKGWDMEKAKQWVKDHEGKSISEIIEHKISQKEIEDEIEFTKLLIDENGMNPETTKMALELVEVIKRISGCDKPVDIEPTVNGTVKSDDEKLQLIISQTVQNVVKNS